MPLSWTIDSRKRLVTAAVIGDVTEAQVLAFVAALAQTDTMAYDKIVDATGAACTMDADELAGIGVTIRATYPTSPGPLVIVLTEQAWRRAARLMGILAAGPGPVGVCTDLETARRWIARANRKARRRARPPAKRPAAARRPAADGKLARRGGAAPSLSGAWWAA